MPLPISKFDRMSKKKRDRYIKWRRDNLPRNDSWEVLLKIAKQAGDELRAKQAERAARPIEKAYKDDLKCHKPKRGAYPDIQLGVSFYLVGPGEGMEPPKRRGETDYIALQTPSGRAKVGAMHKHPAKFREWLTGSPEYKVKDDE